MNFTAFVQKMLLVLSFVCSIWLDLDDNHAQSLKYRPGIDYEHQKSLRFS